MKDWESLCALVFAKYDKDQYQIQLRHLESLKQTGSVSDYQKRFEELAHGIILYNPAFDDTFLVTKFLGGLKEEIRAAILLYRPKDVDTASALALIQEEELEACRLKSSFRNSLVVGFRAHPAVERTKVHDGEKVKLKTGKEEVEDKLATLKQYRRKNGLCFKCREKWAPCHKCPNQVSIHVLEELLDAVDDTDSEMQEVADMSEYEGVMAIGSQLPKQAAVRKTMRLCGKVGALNVMILVDSGSIVSFISTKLAEHLKDQIQTCPPSSFITADGSPMSCTQSIPRLQWCTQGHTFVSAVKVLPLKCYDIILGQDWLEECSPMWVHWTKKIMRFQHKGSSIELYGVKPEVTKCTAISTNKLKGLIKRTAISHCVQVATVSAPKQEWVPYDANICQVEPEVIEDTPGLIQILLSQYPDIFQEPSTLPPRRQHDHRIDLLPGSQPVNVKPYRYTPAQKSEIKTQLSDMLKNGIIKQSTSPCASPVLLVKKKDGPWRFCIDYRHLNAITVKNKHPLLIVDELIDELANAKWFSKLDLRSGYHQICIADGDTHKTAFKTHNGLYEFLVIPFGLTNAPATFQSIMNTVFAPLLRKGVLVFMDDILIYSSTLEEHCALLKQVLEILRENKFYVKMSKCSFAQQTIEYLGHCISGQGVATEPAKILAVQQWPIPKNLKELRGFLGLTGYYRKFIRHYGMISRPLTNMLKKGIPFLWTSVAQQAFELLKSTLTQAPVLAIPNFSKEFTLETDASET